MKWIYKFKEWANVATNWTKLLRIAGNTFDFFMEELRKAFPDNSGNSSNGD